MRNLILEKDTCEGSDGNDGKDDLCTENSRKTVVDLRNLLRDKISKHEIFYSFEIVSVRKSNAFYRRLLAGMEEYSPLFYALTWHNEASENDGYLPLDLAENFPPNTLLHLAAKGLNRDQVVHILRKALAFGIVNIFALRGDSPSENGDFEHAADLVAFIRERFGNTFCVCVAGYPQMHPKSSTKQLDLHYLKAKVKRRSLHLAMRFLGWNPETLLVEFKTISSLNLRQQYAHFIGRMNVLSFKKGLCRISVEAGADFIITQICFESRVLIDFVRDCQEIGIRIPILPGILAPASQTCLEKMADLCGLDVPAEIKDDLARMRNDDQAERNYSVDLVARIITDVIKSGAACGFHLFTLNRLSLVAQICKRLEEVFQAEKPAGRTYLPSSGFQESRESI